MQLDYKQKYNGQYILSKIDIENIATDVLKEFSPCNLVVPTQLDTMSFLQDYLGLNVKRKYIGTFESGILGSIIMCDEMEIPSYDEMFRPTVLIETYGNVLISPNLDSRENAPRRRYTETHEGSHFILHKDYYKCLEQRKRIRKKLELQIHLLKRAILFLYPLMQPIITANQCRHGLRTKTGMYPMHRQVTES